MAAASRYLRPLQSYLRSSVRAPVSPRTTLISPIPSSRHLILSRNGCPRSFGTTSAWLEKKYTKDHEWIELADDGKTGTIGISVYAATSLGDVVYVELPTQDLEVSAGDTIGAVESVKSASDIMTPVSGKIIEGNSILEEKPGTINKGPEGEGWIAKIELQNVKELDELMAIEDYKKFTEE